MKTQASLVQIYSDRAVTSEVDACFLLEFQRDLLLALNECGLLTEPQYQAGAKKLKSQLDTAAGLQSRTQAGGDP